MSRLSAPGEITALFTHEGTYRCARWTRPVAPVVFGVDDATLDIFRNVITAAFAHAKHPVAETDPESGTNLMMFLMAEWDELDAIPDLDKLVGQDGLVERLKSLQADRYQILRFGSDGGIRAAFSFARLGGALAEAHPAALAEDMTVNAMLSFARRVTPSRGLADVIRAAYDPAMPVAASDASHALRLSARVISAHSQEAEQAP